MEKGKKPSEALGCGLLSLRAVGSGISSGLAHTDWALWALTDSPHALGTGFAGLSSEKALCPRPL